MLYSPQIDVLIDRGNAQIEVDWNKHEANNGIGAHHAVYNLPHGRAAIVELTGIACEKNDRGKVLRDMLEREIESALYLPNTERTPSVPRAMDIITATMDTPPVAKT